MKIVSAQVPEMSERETHLLESMVRMTGLTENNTGLLICTVAHMVRSRLTGKPHSEAVVSFLVDHSGSMKKHRFATVATYVDILSRALDLVGITYEVLGFTTGGWSGERVLKS